MKKTYLALFVAILFLQQNTRAQGWLGIYGLRASSYDIKKPDIGGGAGVSFLSGGKEIDKARPGILFQAGFDINYSGLGHRTFRQVPLLAPQMGSAQVRLSNGLLTTNVLFQLAYSNKSIFRPYANAFIGYRGTFSDLTIDPNNRQPGYESETEKSLASAHGLNYGLGAGLLTKLKRNIWLDIGVSYAEMIGGGQMADLTTAYSDKNGVNMNFKNAPNSMMLIKVGLQFYIEKGNDRNDDKDDCHCKCRKSGRVYSGVGLGGGWNWGRSNNVGINVGGIRTK